MRMRAAAQNQNRYNVTTSDVDSIHTYISTYTLEERKSMKTMYMHNIKGECKCYIGNFKEFFTLKVGVHTHTLLRNHSA